MPVDVITDGKRKHRQYRDSPYADPIGQIEFPGEATR